MVYQKPEALNWTNDSLQASKAILHDKPQLPMTLPTNEYVMESWKDGGAKCFLLVFLFTYLYFLLWDRLQGWSVDMEGPGNEWDWVRDVKFPKNQ